MKTFKIICSIAGALALAAILSACNRKPSDATVPVTIGAVLPLTGSYAQYGQHMKQGMELALDDARRSGSLSNITVKLIAEDGQLDLKTSLNAFNKLKDIDHVSALIVASSKILLATKQLANAAHIVLMNASATSSDIEDADDFCFSVLANADKEGTFLAESAYNQLKLRTGAIVYREDASGKSFEKAFTSSFTKIGGKIVANLPHTPDQSDYRDLIAKLRGDEAIQFVFMPSYGPEVAGFVKQAREQGRKWTILTYEAFYSAKTIEVARDAAEGVLFCMPTFGLNPEDPQFRSLQSKVTSKYNHTNVTFQIAANYDAMALLLQAISHHATSGTDIRHYLAQQHTYDGVTGKMTFDDHGAVSLPLTLFTVRNGAFIEYKP